MNYREAITYLFENLPMFQRTGKAAYKANLDNTIRLDRYFSSPHKHFKSIHVAGTNGKGSVSHILASVLREAGYSTGLYTSPHLLDFRERIRINGSLIPEKEIAGFVANHQHMLDAIQPSFFEMTVALAFDYFSRMQVDMAVIETGLGGRLDSTNIILPEVSVITNISKDHTEFLGDSLLSIAGEKAGIIKPGRPVVSGSSDETINKVFADKASELKSDIFFAADRYKCLYSTLTPENRRLFRLAEKNSDSRITIITDLLGDYQKENVITALTVIDLLKDKKWNINQKNVKQGFKNVVKNTGLRGRWEIIGHNPRIVCDIGHNRDGIKIVVSQINNTPWKRLHMVLGFVNDKDIDAIMQELPDKATYYFTSPSVPRALDHKVLKQKAEAFNLRGESYGTVREAFSAAKSTAGPDDMIFVGGSTFVVADLLAIG
ncbi:MAG TPA: bifunctional folylpolyglutamate synthase/dihydrofolate synthase [Bacteroidaceae bacterium]|nr:bifunctional folylpolyglutamate synthase/dihydrofolate synthase [Bacteroidaceae bacterium]